MNTLRILAVLTAVFVFATNCARSNSVSENAVNDAGGNTVTEQATPTAAVVDDVAEGKKHFVANCVRCHKEDGTGGRTVIEGETINAENLTTAKMIKEPDSEYIEYIEDGIKDEGMPAFKDVLSKAEIEQVVKYIRKEIQKQ